MVPEEQDINAHHNGHQSEHVKRDGGLSSHRFKVPGAGSPELGRAERKSARMCRCSGVTPEPAVQDETACNSDDSTADGIECNQAGQQERQDNAGCATLPVALRAYEDDFRDPEEERGGEQRSARLREPKPTAEPLPIASQQRHARILVVEPTTIVLVTENSLADVGL